MSSARLAGSPGPHVFVDSLASPVLNEDDVAHLERSLRMRDGDALTLSDARGSWCRARFRSGGAVEVDGETFVVAEPEYPITVAFSLVKGAKPEFVIQKLTEVGVDHIVVLDAERTIVRWDEAKVTKAKSRWDRVVREASMQSHRVRLPSVEGIVSASSYLASSPDLRVAHFDGRPIGSHDRAIAIGPEGGWSDPELANSGDRVRLGETVQRSETAAISAAALLTAARAGAANNGG